MPRSQATLMLVYIKKLVAVIAGRLPGLHGRSCPLDTDSPELDKRARDIKISIEGSSEEIRVNPILLENSFADMPSDHLKEGEASTLQTRFEYGVTVLNCARVFSDSVTHISVYDCDNKIREEYSAHHRIAPPQTLQKQCSTVYTGTTLHLAAEITTLNGNLFHWLLDAMGRMLLLDEKVEQQPAIDRYLIPPKIPMYRECMIAMGVPEDKLIELPLGQSVQFERLVWVTNPCGYSSHIVPGWLIQAYRKRFSKILAKGMGKNTRIYISRKDAITRKFTNEEKLASALQARGYKIVELSEYGLAEKIRLFSDAAEVIGMSGAGLACLLFSRPGTQVIELYPSTFVNYNIASISYQLGHVHVPYIFQSHSLLSKLNSFSGEFEMDIEHFLEFYDSIDSQAVMREVSNA